MQVNQIFYNYQYENAAKYFLTGCNLVIYNKFLLHKIQTSHFLINFRHKIEGILVIGELDGSIIIFKNFFNSVY